MATSAARLLGLAATLGLGLLAPGCASSGPVSSRFGMMNTLKTSVAQLEGDNQTLRRQVAQLKAENGRIDDQLARQESANNEMAARLDDARELIARQGGSTNALGRAGKLADDEAIPPPVKTINRRTPRTPPAASIPRPEVEEPADDVLDLGPAPKRSGRSRSLDRDPGPQSRRDADRNGRWTPVVEGRKPTTRS